MNSIHALKQGIANIETLRIPKDALMMIKNVEPGKDMCIVKIRLTDGMAIKNKNVGTS